MALEVWGTFSVTDHKRPRAFVADVLLYDRLVIPMPVNDDDDVWAKNGWEPKELRARLNILGKDLARVVPWTPEQRQRFQTRYAHEKHLTRKSAIQRLEMAEAVEFDAANIRAARTREPDIDPMWVTRMILVDHANQKRDREFFRQHPDVYVEAVAAYPSYDVLMDELDIRPMSAGKPLSRNDQSDLAGVFGWEFFVPYDPDLSDEDLLEEAATLARKKSFRQARADFHEWRRELVAHGGDTNTALADMRKNVERYREETARLRTKTVLLNGFTIIGGAASLAATFLFPPIGAVGSFLTLARFGVEKLLPGPGLSQEARRGAMFADARKHFGWKDVG